MLDVDETLVDNSVVPATVERACDAVAAAVGALDPSELLAANTAAWNSYWPEVERRCWVGEMEVLDVSREVWRRALHRCGTDDPAVVDLAYEMHQRIGREMSRLFDDVPGFLRALQLPALIDMARPPGTGVTRPAGDGDDVRATSAPPGD